MKYEIELTDRDFDTLAIALRDRAHELLIHSEWIKDFENEEIRKHVWDQIRKERQEALELNLKFIQLHKLGD